MSYNNQFNSQQQQDSDPRTPQTHVLTKDVLTKIIKQLTDNLGTLNDDGTAELLIKVADDLTDNAVIGISQLAKHRGSDTIEAKDVQLYFDRQFNGLELNLDGIHVRPAKRPITTDGHKQRMSLIKKGKK
jgi:transcription initiation factor TFIID subunit 12